MTTGRINQVTILNPGASPEGMGAREAPEGAECYKSWGTHTR